MNPTPPTLLLAAALWATPAARAQSPSAEPAASPSVHRGQTVVLIASAEDIRLSAPGRALKDGQPGDTIPVLNTATRRPLRGVVRDGWIEIESEGEPHP